MYLNIRQNYNSKDETRSTIPNAERVKILETRNKIAVDTINELKIHLRKKFCNNEISDGQLPADGKQLLQELQSLEAQNNELRRDLQCYKTSGRARFEQNLI